MQDLSLCHGAKTLSFSFDVYPLPLQHSLRSLDFSNPYKSEKGKAHYESFDLTFVNLISNSFWLSCICMNVQVCMCVGVQGQYQVSSSDTSHLIFWDMVSHWTWSFPVWLDGVADKPQGPPQQQFPQDWDYGCRWHLAFFMCMLGL